MKFTEKYSRAFNYLLPSPFTIAIVLSIFTFCIALFFTKADSQSYLDYSTDLFTYWETGIWNNALLVFAMQMMLMLVLGHTLALTPAISKSINIIVRYANNGAKAAFLVSSFTIIIALFNWGLGLIFGAILARKIGEYASEKAIPINYPLIGASGYLGLMVWHGGISGSSLTKVAETNHIKNMMEGILPEKAIQSLPETIGFSETVFSSMNITACLLILFTIPTLAYYLGKKKQVVVSLKNNVVASEEDGKKVGAEKLDYSTWLPTLIGSIILLFVIYKSLKSGSLAISPNFINLCLFALALILHKNIVQFLKAIDSAIGGAAGILIQFPLYFGIMGIMKSSGLVNELSNFFVQISDAKTFPLLTMFSAGLVNIFVPSGGGQWAVQGPIIIAAATKLNLGLSKCIMALAYGDQLTNMLQPFWALPLLGITKLKAKEILPYTLLFMLVGTLVYLAVLLLF